MTRANQAQKVERLNVAYALLTEGLTVNETVLRLVQHFGMSRRQSYRYVQQARVMKGPAEPFEALLPMTIKVPGGLAARLRAHAKNSGQTIGEIVVQALRHWLPDKGRNG